jgi:hypothetical protein
MLADTNLTLIFSKSLSDEISNKDFPEQSIYKVQLQKSTRFPEERGTDSETNTCNAGD